MQSGHCKKNFWRRLKRNFLRHKGLYLLLLPIIAYFLIFKYYPMYGAQIAFRDFSPKKGIWGSNWVGIKHFKRFFDSIYFGRLVRNTLSISIKSLVIGFPLPIILALMLNEVRNVKFKRIVQTISYLPHFISTVVVAGMVLQFTASDGFVTYFLQLFGYSGGNLLYDPDMFQPIYVLSGVWQGLGWNSIIYIAAIAGINAELYEAAKIDGAGKWKQVIHITLPGIVPTTMTMFILNLGGLMGVGAEKIILLYNDAILEKADVISSYVYRMGLLERNYSFSSAVGLFNTFINLILIVSANKISKKVARIGLW